METLRTVLGYIIGIGLLLGAYALVSALFSLIGPPIDRLGKLIRR